MTIDEIQKEIIKSMKLLAELKYSHDQIKELKKEINTL